MRGTGRIRRMGGFRNGRQRRNESNERNRRNEIKLLVKLNCQFEIEF